MLGTGYHLVRGFASNLKGEEFPTDRDIVPLRLPDLRGDGGEDDLWATFVEPDPCAGAMAPHPGTRAVCTKLAPWPVRRPPQHWAKA